MEMERMHELGSKLRGNALEITRNPLQAMAILATGVAQVSMSMTNFVTNPKEMLESVTFSDRICKKVSRALEEDAQQNPVTPAAQLIALSYMITHICNELEKQVDQITDPRRSQMPPELQSLLNELEARLRNSGNQS